MKTSTLRLARRLASQVELRDVQQALMEDAFGARDWGGAFFADNFALRDLAQKRRELADARAADGKAGNGKYGGDPLSDGHHRHGPDHPVAADVDAADLAVCLMLLPGLVAVGAQTLVAALNTAQPIVAVRGNIRGFERCFGALLDGLFQSKRRKAVIQHIGDADELAVRSGKRTTDVTMLHIRSGALRDATPRQIRKCLSAAISARMPIVLTREDAAFTFPVRMSSAVDLTIDAAPLDWPTLAELIDARTGIAAKEVMAAAGSGRAIDLARLSLDDLTLAIRPGRGLDTILSTLADLAEAADEDPVDDDKASKTKSGSSSTRNRNGTAGTGSVRIDPQPLPPTEVREGDMDVGVDRTCDAAKAATVDAGSMPAPSSDAAGARAADGNGDSSTSCEAAIDAGPGADRDPTRSADRSSASGADPKDDGGHEFSGGNTSDAGHTRRIGPAQDADRAVDAGPVGNVNASAGDADGAKPDSDKDATSAPNAAPLAVKPRPRVLRPPVVTVETLAGYGKASDWALDLKADLAHWKAGTLPWSDLSSKLLLSGPPGTGKTTFARALGNTLQLPVFATSVSTWLEASYLGDVLKRMRACFDEAGAAKPCILFIDEIDGIGRRQDQSRDYADYWNSLVNKLLELMDGAIRSEGIIVVGATNRPDDIEPALRRSGRLETHIVIPKPDMKALEGIIAFHLGDDLGDVVASAPDRAAAFGGEGGEAQAGQMWVGETREPAGDNSHTGESAGEDRGEGRLSAAGGEETIDAINGAGVGAGSDPRKNADRVVAPVEMDKLRKPAKRKKIAAEASSAMATDAHAQQATEQRQRPAGTTATTVRGAPGTSVASAPAAGGRAPAPTPETSAERRSRALRLLARAATGLTGADVERVVREERQRCRRESTAMTFDPLKIALRAGRPDLPAGLRRQVAVHEAGHAVAFRALDLGTQGEMTIDGAEGGMSLTTLDMTRVQSEDRLMDLLAMNLAGRAAEVVYGLAPLAGSGTASGSDLHASTHLALELECRAGYSKNAPLLYIEPDSFNAIHLARPDAYLKANARLETAFATARQVIEKQRDAHAALVEALLAYGTLDGAEVDAILVRYMETASGSEVAGPISIGSSHQD
ncbi:MAG: AAA family ATPase [Aliihoeflea sp.]|uniref:AAA family ATPase n=1 Tax=Aliihoeflea sp. TaxID=2608088 RepID=UPI0040379248